MTAWNLNSRKVSAVVWSCTVGQMSHKAQVLILTHYVDISVIIIIYLTWLPYSSIPGLGTSSILAGTICSILWTLAGKLFTREDLIHVVSVEWILDSVVLRHCGLRWMTTYIFFMFLVRCTAAVCWATAYNWWRLARLCRQHHRRRLQWYVKNRSSHPSQG